MSGEQKQQRRRRGRRAGKNQRMVQSRYLAVSVCAYVCFISLSEGMSRVQPESALVCVCAWNTHHSAGSVCPQTALHWAACLSGSVPSGSTRSHSLPWEGQGQCVCVQKVCVDKNRAGGKERIPKNYTLPFMVLLQTQKHTTGLKHWKWQSAD